MLCFGMLFDLFLSFFFKKKMKSLLLLRGGKEFKTSTIFRRTKSFEPRMGCMNRIPVPYPLGYWTTCLSFGLCFLLACACFSLLVWCWLRGVVFSSLDLQHNPAPHYIRNIFLVSSSSSDLITDSVDPRISLDNKPNQTFTIKPNQPLENLSMRSKFCSNFVTNMDR